MILSILLEKSFVRSERNEDVLVLETVGKVQNPTRVVINMRKVNTFQRMEKHCIKYICI